MAGFKAVSDINHGRADGSKVVIQAGADVSKGDFSDAEWQSLLDAKAVSDNEDDLRGVGVTLVVGPTSPTDNPPPEPVTEPKAAESGTAAEDSRSDERQRLVEERKATIRTTEPTTVTAGRTAASTPTTAEVREAEARSARPRPGDRT